MMARSSSSPEALQALASDLEERLAALEARAEAAADTGGRGGPSPADLTAARRIAADARQRADEAKARLRGAA